MRVSQVGTLESCDCMVTFSPLDPGNGLNLNIQSAVNEQFGGQIRRTVLGVLEEMQVEDAEVSINDMGALDFVIRARVRTAVLRSKEGEV